ncbi:STM3941 family protein [Microbispora sp. ZYX-F-249]|uniref:STM3941 family protein n=1 Tax=Microbispora maris TaxID=3144104 RepID=A0ABV0B0V2_9ACTN
MGLPDGEVVEWRRSTLRTLLMLFLCAVMIAGSAAIAFDWLSTGWGVLATMTGWLGMVLFSIAGLGWVWQFVRRDPVVIQVGPLGFHDRRVSGEPIPWDDIDAVATRTNQRQRFLILQMPPEVWRRHLHSRPFAFLARATAMSYGGVGVSANGLDRSFDELVAVVRKWHRAAHPGSTDS